MRVFRRRTSDAPDVLDLQQAQPNVQSTRQAGKGRPTPKRSEVERRRREPQPADRQATRSKSRADYQRKREAARRGEDWALRPADKGPVRALARDYVDSRRLIISEYVLLVAFVAILGIFLLGAAANSKVILYLEVGILGVIIVESLYHASRVTKLAKERFPGQSTRGLGWYIAKRAMRLRMSREPQARVGRGAAI
jgi:hypothetical protein